MVELSTERLLLRRWREEDRAPFAALNADPEVMEHFPAPLTRAESDATADRFEERLHAHGYAMWALEVWDSGAFIGFTGIQNVPFDAAFTPAVEVGWRLARPAWGHGYASEAARASLRHGFGTVGLTEIVAMTSTTNLRSQAVMERLGMTRDPADDFDNPRVPAGSPLLRHVLYRRARD
ncbi:MAG: GNAT family N-acetyltransferase [Streptosporangiaceae bacterium]